MKLTKPHLILGIILLIAIGGCGGFLVGSSLSEDSDSHADNSSQAADDHSHSMASHEKYNVSSVQAPTVKISVEEDEVSGWNIMIDTTKFKFAPENVNGENKLGEGHAHLYVDGKKVARIYGNYFHYGEDFDGEKTFKVTLNANDHGEYSVGDKVVSDQVVVSHDHHE